MLLAPLFVVAALQAKPPPEVDAIVAQRMSTDHVPGVALAILAQGRVTAEGCYGRMDLADDAPVTPSSAFRIASLSKAILATAAMLLVEEGRLSLDDPVSKWIADSPEAWSRITVRQLLSHTGGLAREMVGYRQDRPYTRDELMAMAKETPPFGEPGEKYAYSNVGYFLVGETISKAARKPWPQFVAERIFRPLGMDAAALSTDPVRNRVVGYDWTDGAFRPSPVLANLRTSGAFVATIRDMERWAGEQLKPRIVPFGIFEKMWTPTPLRDGGTSDYGLGWNVDKEGLVRHNGANAGFRAALYVYRNEGVAVVVLTNGTGADPDRLARDVAALYRRR